MTEAIAQRTHSVHPDQPQGKNALRFFPILGPSHEQPPYRQLEGDALSAVKVTETSLSGSVPELKVENTLDVRVFLMDGQELVGAKQNRILNTDVLVPAKTTLSIPVSCVEAGRWRHVSDAFVPGKSASHTIRSRKHQRVHESLRRDARHDADQRAVWDEVQTSMSRACSSSPTAALHDAYDHRQKEMDALRGLLRMPDDAVGLAVFHGPKFLGLDLFDRHSTLLYFWQSLLESYAIDWLMIPQAGADAAAPEVKAVPEVLDRAAAGKWESFASPGDGRDHRLEDDRFTGSALVWEDQVLLHLQVFPKAQDQTEAPRPAPRSRPRIRRPYTRPGG